MMDAKQPCIGCGEPTDMCIPYTCCDKCGKIFENILDVIGRDPNFSMSLVFELGKRYVTRFEPDQARRELKEGA